MADSLTTNRPKPSPARPLFIVGFGGTTRAGSSSERLIAAVLKETAALGAETRLFTGPDLAVLPHYAPENPSRTEAQQAFVDAIRKANGIVIGSPTYHGGISGLVKNAIDLVTDLADDTRVYFDGRPVGLAVTAGGWQGAGMTLSAMRDMVHALRGWPTPIGLAVNSGGQAIFDGEGAVIDAGIRGNVEALARQIVNFARAEVSPFEGLREMAQ
jgi:FMN reductase